MSFDELEINLLHSNWSHLPNVKTGNDFVFLWKIIFYQTNLLVMVQSNARLSVFLQRIRSRFPIPEKLLQKKASHKFECLRILWQERTVSLAVPIKKAMSAIWPIIKNR